MYSGGPKILVSDIISSPGYGKLSDWEKKFVHDLSYRLYKKLGLSPNQSQKLMSIHRKSVVR